MKASTKSPLKRAQTERWKPQKGQSYPVTAFSRHLGANITCSL